MFVGFDADSEDAAFVATVDIPAGEVIYFTDDEWNGSQFNTNEQLIEWIVPAGGIPAGTVVTMDMVPAGGSSSASFSIGGDVDYIRGGGQLATQNEMLWAFQGTRTGNTVTPTNFIGVVANEADGNNNQTPNLNGTGLTTSNGAIIIDGDEDYMEYTADGSLPSPVTRAELIASISDTSNWTTADGNGNSNPNPTDGFDVVVPPVVCFTAGTLISTPDGARAIETLAKGDLVDTVDSGAQPVRWIGHRTVAAVGNFAPIRFARGIFGNDRPLLVSPQHRLLISGWQAQLLYGASEILIPAAALVNDTTVRRVSGGVVTYLHLLFDNHEVIYAEGIPAESLFPGRVALSSLEGSARQEVLSLFPELANRLQNERQMARLTPRMHDAGALRGYFD